MVTCGECRRNRSTQHNNTHDKRRERGASMHLGRRGVLAEKT
ncbi:hypothetical protein BBTM_00807 [Bifidobacterium bifidum]|nr:hypothetical protein BBTM_00807 [Bifidobacterium bifidum]